MDPRSQEKLNKILAKDLNTLSEDDMGFLKARRSYIKLVDLERYENILNPKKAKLPVKETVKKHVNTK